MRDIATTILELGNKLDLDERTVVAHKLLETLYEGSDSDTDVETAWQVELRHRIDDIEKWSGRIGQSYRNGRVGAQYCLWW